MAILTSVRWYLIVALNSISLTCSDVTHLLMCLSGHLSIFFGVWVCMLSCSAVVDSLQFHGLRPSRLLHPWNFPGKNIGVGCHFLLQGIFLNQELNVS